VRPCALSDLKPTSSAPSAATVLGHRRNLRAVHRALAEPKTPRSLCGIVHFCFAQCAPCLSSPAAATPMLRKRRGAFITATSGSTWAAIHQNTQGASPSTRRAARSRSRGVSFTPSVTEADFNAYRRNRAFTPEAGQGDCRPQADSSCRRPDRLLLQCFAAQPRRRPAGRGRKSTEWIIELLR